MKRDYASAALMVGYALTALRDQCGFSEADIVKLLSRNNVRRMIDIVRKPASTANGDGA